MQDMRSLTEQHRTFTVCALILSTLVAIAGCGGGGGGAPNQPDPPTPSDTISALGQTTRWLDNDDAEDLLDNWNDSAALDDVVQTSPLDQNERVARVDNLRSLLQSPDNSRGTSQTLLRNVDIDSSGFSVIGARDGITYGQWKAGPAGTLDIDFDYRFAPEFDAEDRARMERAGKSWSWRLNDDYGTNTVTARRIASSSTQDGVTAEEMVMTDDFTTDDVLIFVQQHDGTLRSQGGWSHRSRSARDRNDYQAYAGFVRIGEHRFTRVPSRGDLGLTSIMAHEIGHVLGIGLGLWDTQYFQDLVDEQASTFNGPNAVAAHGGPVPFQWLDSNRNPVPPNTPGATEDRGHLGPCTSVMAYCRHQNDIYAPTELDFGFLADIGYDVLEAGIVDEPEVYGFGAWGRYSAWGAGVERTISYDTRISGRVEHLVEQDRLRAGADAFGVAPATNLSDGTSSTPQETVTWSGSLIGVDLGSPGLPPVFGDAELSVDLSSLEGSARFEDLTVVANGASGGFRTGTLQYGITVTGNSFSDSDRHVTGGFFGPGHEEMAGVLRDETASVNLLAGFGGTQ